MIAVIPRIYPEVIPGHPGPLFWRDEQSGRLREAVEAFLDHLIDRRNKPEPTPHQLALLIDYVDYWAQAPCWRSLGKLEELRASIKSVLTVDELKAWLHEALEEGIDPL